MEKNIVIKGAKENNLKGVDLTIPRDKMIVFTGLLGLWQIFTCIRHDIRRGTEEVRGVMLSRMRQFLGSLRRSQTQLN